MPLVLLSRLGQLQDKLEVLASTDALTGLPNRRVMIERLTDATARGERGTLLIADIDFCKRINDTHGHAAGDACLKSVAHLLKALCRAGHVARFGGEEFVAWLPDTSRQDARVVAGKIAAGTHVAVPNGTDLVTLSVGIAQRRGGNALQDLMQCADEAIYLAKSSGRARAIDSDHGAQENSIEPHRAHATG